MRGRHQFRPIKIDSPAIEAWPKLGYHLQEEAGAAVDLVHGKEGE